MKRCSVICFLLLLFLSSKAQLSVRYNPSIQPTHSMQYFKPVGNNLFVGDCIPFFHNGTYYLYWLIDSAHHHALNGLGGHQWVLSTTKDLKTWTNYPIVLGIDEDWEKSICTGSVVFDKGQYYAFYATRLVNGNPSGEDIKQAPNGIWSFVNEQLSYAISPDAVHFKKQKPNPFYTSAPGYSKRDFRDPKVFVDSVGMFHLLVASKQDSAPLQNSSGALVHLTSKDLKNWDVQQPVLTGQNSTPECPDYFLWNGWYYLVYSDNSNTFYVKSKSPYGPWQEPSYQALNEDWANVVKTAQFGTNRRIAAAWVPSRVDNKDEGREIFGGNVVFREVLQLPDGTLNTKFPVEMLPQSSQITSLQLHTDSFTSKTNDADFSINSPNGVGTAHYENIPSNCRISLQINPKSSNEEYGLIVRADNKGANSYKLSFSANDLKVNLGATSITGVAGLDHPIQVDIIMKDDIIDVCVDNRRCIVNRMIEHRGNNLWFYAKHGQVAFNSIKVYGIDNDKSVAQVK